MIAVAAAPTAAGVIRVLSKARLVDVARQFGASLRPDLTKDVLVGTLAAAPSLDLSELLASLGRDELRAACRAHGIDDKGRARLELTDRLLAAAGLGSVQKTTDRRKSDLPEADDIVQVRHRQYLVREVVAAPDQGQQTLVKLVCLDDDDQGRQLEVLWELELGARVLEPEAQGLGTITQIDSPRHFAAYLHALKWNCVTATDGKLFQSPFRAGIKLMNHQLTPLKKALELPRANLFIADDVGLGKTIEAGLVLGELLLRQRVDWALIVCPASVSLQWRDEMERRFGLHFEIYNRAFVGRRRQERGFGVNPWATHTRFIISYQTLRRPEYRDGLVQHLQRLGDRAPKSLLILDEAHTAAPSTASKYAIDSKVTGVIRDLAPRFENRLFLSATPHNGHSNSFSALLEILDPQRFTRGVPVVPKQLETVMVRRLKSDLRALPDGEKFPKRNVVQIDLRHEGNDWSQRYIVDEKPEAPTPAGTGSDAELQLSRLLAEYTALMKPQKGPGQLVFINLQKRLLSSVEAFSRTLKVHARSVASTLQKMEAQATLQIDVDSDDEYGVDDDAQDEAEAADIEQRSRSLPSATGRARELLEQMLSLTEQNRTAPDAKVLAVIDWIRRNQCDAAQIGGAPPKSKARWSGTRLLIFTEYGDTKRYLTQMLGAAIESTPDASERIMTFHGGMSDEQREEVQRAFNSPPSQHPVRILIATDAAREGVNLQGHCADLIHFDIPWNPARMEQRNGRIDRTLQPAAEVRCMYFVYPQRPEDRILQTLVRKVDQIQRDLGSLGTVVMGRLASVLERGIDDTSTKALEEASQPGLFQEVTTRELESQRPSIVNLSREIEEAGNILDASRQVMEFDPALLRDAIDVGCGLAGSGPLSPVAPQPEEEKLATFTLPTLPESWQVTLDTLRPPRQRDEEFWDWRKRAPQPVVFDPPSRMNSGLVHLHLQHPFVQRILDRLLAQGHSAHDLSRVTVIRNRHDSSARVIAFGRLSLFGAGATRLHDKLVPVAARWLESGGAGHLQPFADKNDRKTLERLEQLLVEAPHGDDVPNSVKQRLAATAAKDFSSLWPYIEAEADHERHEAERMLSSRAAEESEALRRILTSQRAAIVATLDQRSQLALPFSEGEKEQRDQFERDRKHMSGRLESIQAEIEREPQQIVDLYKIALRRLQPVGLIYLWPGTR